MMDGLTHDDARDLATAVEQLREQGKQRRNKHRRARRVLFYRLETGLVHLVLVPDHGVLRQRTVERLATGLGYLRVGDPGREGQISDCPQMYEGLDGLEVVEVDTDPGGEMSPGSVALRFRAATREDALALARALGTRIVEKLEPARSVAQSFLDTYRQIHGEIL
jgi:hypothetical protein